MPSSRYFAVALPNERARRSRGGREHGGRVGRRHLRGGVHRHRLDVLGSQHRAESAAPGVPTVVGDRGVAHAALAGRADRRDPPAGTEPRAQRRLGVGGRQPPDVLGRLEPGAVAVDEQHRRPLAPPAHDDRVVAGELARDGEVARGQRVGQQPGQRRLGDDGELRARGERGTHQRREAERQRRLGSQRVDAGRGELGQQPRAQARPTQVVAQHLGRTARPAVDPPVPTSTTSARPK